jgi:hypothetical protein
MNNLEAMAMEPISYFNALLADSRITMLQILDIEHTPFCPDLQTFVAKLNY